MAYWYGKNFSGTKTTAKRFKNALAGKKIPLHLYTRSMGNMISGEEAEAELRKLV